MDIFAAVILIRGIVFRLCAKQVFTPIFPLPVNLVTIFHQYRRGLLASSEYPNVTDTQTDRQTDTARRHRPRLRIGAKTRILGLPYGENGMILRLLACDKRADIIAERDKNHRVCHFVLSTVIDVVISYRVTFDSPGSTVSE